MRGALLALFAFANAALAATEGPGVNQFIRAQRTAAPIEADGKLDEPQWRSAEPFSDFIQFFPAENGVPSERTELRVLYDDDNLYIGVICFDSHPAEVAAGLGRRDTPPPSDAIWVAIDSTHDHRTAFGFSVNAGGVLTDGLFFDDSNFTSNWDAAWDGAAA